MNEPTRDEYENGEVNFWSMAAFQMDAEPETAEAVRETRIHLAWPKKNIYGFRNGERYLNNFAP